MRKARKGKVEMTANELADYITENSYIGTVTMEDVATMLRQQQNEIDRLNYDLDGFKQNFFVSGFHLQIKMANEQLLKQQEQIDALKSELDRAVELYTEKAIENEALEKELTEAGGMIGVLREYISDLENGLDSSIKLNKAQAERNNEPVAWLLFCDGDESFPQYTKSYKQMREWETYIGDNQRIEPHYTHPVKELTDEEIRHIQAICHLKDVGYDNFIMRFARAILRKAQE
jgi:hypothetical protein